MKKVFMLLVLGLSCLCMQAQTSQSMYETQLEQLKTNLAGYPVKLDSYTNKGVIGTNEKLKALKTQLLSDTDSYFPTGDNDGKFFF